jgi:hypothetical protein
MNTFIRHATMASVVAVTALATAGLAQAGSADYDDYGCSGEIDDCGYDNAQKYKEDEDEYAGKPRHQEDEKEVTVSVTVTESKNDWKYDAGKHKRRHHKDDEYRFYNAGYWYPEAYWQGYGLVSEDRLSCREGRSVVRNRGFRRVQPLDCHGRTFTYVAHRHGDVFKVLVNSRTGRIVDVDPI